MHKHLTLLTAIAFTAGLSMAQADSARLAQVLADQPEAIQARYEFRHPQETLEFFGIEPGMTVVEALPGGGWYSKILLPYLGKDGALIGADYALDMYRLLGIYGAEELEGKKAWVTSWTAEAESWRNDDSAKVSAFVLGSMPDELKGTADAVLLIRALHNLKSYEGQGGFLTSALQNAYDVLKPGGIVGVVQHWAPDARSDAFADGSHGYLKKDYVIQRLTAAGFEFVAESDINVNRHDRPGEGDIVWRLPPSLSTSKGNPELDAEMRSIGESTRMTLKFRKP